MRSRPTALVVMMAGILAACGGGAEREPVDAAETPLPAQTPIGAEDAERPIGGVVDPGEVPDADRDGLPNAQDTSFLQP